MKRDLLQQLKNWRNEQARVEGVEQYRVLSNACIQAIVERMPQNKEELTEVKGIKEAKSRKYGKTILAMVSDAGASLFEKEPKTAAEISNEPLSVGQFLDGVNIELSGLAARVRGEVSSVDVRDRVVYFTLKDAVDEGTLNCLIFRYQYDISAVDLAVGDEVIVEGVPEIYKPSGRFSLRAGVIELAGEGALKKAYDALKKKLEEEGLFAPERKREIPKLVERIGLITSSDGAAIGDFTMNVGSNGLKVDFYPTAVEGKKAVFEIIKALRFFQKSEVKYDCLALIRGGGSLESLQAFNNESLVREVAAMPMPVLAGIGHEKDITLAALVADLMVSTPTAAARILGTPWEEARVFVEHVKTLLLQAGTQMIDEKKAVIEEASRFLEAQFENLLTSVERLEQAFREKLQIFPYLFSSLRKELQETKEKLLFVFREELKDYQEVIVRAEASLRQSDPERLLALGYSLVRSGDRVLRSSKNLRPGDKVDIQFGDGRVESEVIKKL